MSASDDNADQSFSVERLDDYRCNLDDIVLDSPTPENTTGAFGDLFTGTHPTEGKLALKRPRGDLYNSKVVAAIEIEASVWKSLRHPRILQFLGIHTIDDSVYFVSPYAENGSLPEFIQRRPEVDRKRLVIEIAEGLVYLHQCAIVHGDLKGNNVLISKEEHVQICDFGLAKHVTSRTATSMRGVGSLPWQSPEMLQNAGKKTFRSDVYAFGITVYEVLSGEEPYSQHSGLAGIVVGVMTGERPPKDPSTGSDGSSYLQFWEEAERCWDVDPTRRPSMVSVLRRLDRRRFEMLVTSQQISLESSLDVDDQERTHLQGTMALPLFNLEGKSLEPLEWGRRIQTRINGLHNLHRPITRLSPEAIGCIILEASPATSPLNAEAYVNTVTSWARSRTVCKAWCRAMDNTPEFWRHIWVHRGGHNIAHIKRLKIVGPLRCLINNWDFYSFRSNEMWSGLRDCIVELRSDLEIEDMNRWLWAWFSDPLPRSQLRSLGLGILGASKDQFAFLTDFANRGLGEASPIIHLEGLAFENFAPNSFRGVKVLKMANMVVRDSFLNDVCAFIRISRDIIELHLRSITVEGDRSDLRWDSARQPSGSSLYKDGPLRTVSLVGLHPSIATKILDFLANCRLKVLEVDNLDPEWFRNSTGGDSAIIKGLGCLSPSRKISFTVKGRMAYVNFRSHTTPGRLGRDESDKGYKLESGCIGFFTQQASDRETLFDFLSARGIWGASNSVMIAPALDHSFFTALSHTKLIILENVALALSALAPDYHGFGLHQYPMPLLEELILIESDETAPPSTCNDRPFQKLCGLVAWRHHTASHAKSRIAKLKRLGVPSHWIGWIDDAKRIYPAFRGIEVYDTNEKTFS